MQYKIKVEILEKTAVDLELEGDVLIEEIIQFLEQHFPDIFTYNDWKQKFVIKSQALQKCLDSHKSISDLLGQIQKDHFKLCREYSQDKNSEIKITFEYKKQKQQPTLFPSQVSIEQLYKFGINLFSIQENVGMTYNDTDLLQFKNASLHQIVKQTEALIKFISKEATIKQENTILIQIQVTDGSHVRAFQTYFQPSYQLSHVQRAALIYCGLNEHIAHADIFIDGKPYSGSKLQKTLQQLNLCQQNLIIHAKIRWQGGHLRIF